MSTQSLDVTIVDDFRFVMKLFLGSLNPLVFLYYGFSNRRAGHVKNCWDLQSHSMTKWPLGFTLSLWDWSRAIFWAIRATSRRCDLKLNAHIFSTLCVISILHELNQDEQPRRKRVAQLLMLPQSHVAASCRRPR